MVFFNYNNSVEESGIKDDKHQDDSESFWGGFENKDPSTEEETYFILSKHAMNEWKKLI